MPDDIVLPGPVVVSKQAVGAGAHLRLAIPPDGPVGRVVELTGINRHVPVYATLQLAIHEGAPPPG
jgi:hypothetical protein